MEESNKFIKGMNQDVHPGGQFPHTYREMRNFIPLSDDGNIYSISNEDGTVLIDSISFPVGMSVIGYTVLNTDIIVFLAGENGSQIGYIREDSSFVDIDYGYYHPVAPFDDNYDPITEPRLAFPENNTEFGFDIDHPVDCVARKLINGHRVVYFTDNFNPIGRVELEAPPVIGTVRDEIRLTFNQNIPEIKLSAIQENVVGSLRPGVYQFVSRYVTKNGGRTTFGIPCDLISITPESKSVGVNDYHGEFHDTLTVNKNIIITIDEVDQTYQEIEIAVSYYTGGGVLVTNVVATLPITSSSIRYTFTGLVGEEEAITREEIRQEPISYKRAKCIEQKDNTLFLSNLSDEDINDDALQQVANHITTSYKIKELPYSGREGNATTPSPTIFSPTSIIIQNRNQLVVTFSTTPLFNSFTAGVNNGGLGEYGGLDHYIEKTEEPATGLIDHSLTVATDTVEIDSETYTCVPIGTITVPSLEFEYSTDSTQMARNLAKAINLDDNRDYSATILDDGGTIKTHVVWKGQGGEGETLTYVGGITGDATLTGEVIATTVSYATNMELTGTRSIVYTFSAITDISEVDLFSSFNIVKFLDNTESTSPSGTPTMSTQDDTTGGFDSVSQGFTDFLDEKVIFDSKSYRRNEVYSFGIMYVFKDGSTSFTYHIPGNNKTDTAVGKYPNLGIPNYNTGETSNTLGTYISSLSYPQDQFFPGDEDGDELIAPNRNIRHHLMPSLLQEPHFRDLGGGQAVIRSLGVKFELDPSYDIPAELKDKIQEIVFVRERRNIDQNKSVYAQGLINRMVETADHCDNSGTIDGTVIDGVRNSYCLQEMPFFNNLEAMIVGGANKQESSGHSRRGVCWPGASAAEGSFGGGPYTFDNGKKLNTSIRGNRAFFHSPESILSADTGIDADSLLSATMKPALLLTGVGYSTNNATNQFKGDGGDDWCEGYMFGDMHGSYTGYDNAYVYDGSGDRVIDAVASRPPGQRRNNAIDPDTNFPNATTTRWTQGGWEVKVNNPNSVQPNVPYEPEHTFIDSGTPKLYINHSVYVADKSSLCFSQCKTDVNEGFVGRVSNGLPLATGEPLEIKNHLYNVELDNNTQYGQLTSASYIPIGRSEIDGLTYDDIFSGDTYITKFSFNTGALVWNYPYTRDGTASVNRPFRSNSRRDYFHIEAGPESQDDSSFKADGFDYRTCHYYFVESEINTYYRHRPEDETRQNYFPNEPEPQANLASFFAYLGNIQAYNGLYSYENNLKEYYIKGSTQETVTSFENRTIYSETAASDSIIDSYRSFLVNNYYDLPAHKGPIWDTFVHNNTLYMHTPKSCWRTFAEPAATLQGGNISDVVLGIGNLFARPSQEMLTAEGGYGGSISQFGGVHSQIGYIFPDVLQGKILALTYSKDGPILKDLSAEGMSTFFHKTMGYGLITIGGEKDFVNVTTNNAHLIDNPFNSIGFNGGYDYKLKRAWITKQGGETISYSLLTSSWFSFHNYTPQVYIPFDNRVFMINDSELWEMNIGDKGNFFDTIYPSQLEFISAEGGDKTFNNQVVDVEIYNTGIKIKNDFFDTYQAWTDKHNTGLLNFTSGNSFAPSKTDSQIFYKYRGDEYRLAIPKDAVLNNSGDLFDPDNLYIPQGGNVAIDNNYIFRERLKADHTHFKMTYDNTTNNTFVLREIKTIFEKNFR